MRFTSRRGNTIVEFAIVSPIALFLLFGLIIGGMGVSRYQQIGYLSREASRWASVHGAEYAAETGHAAATATDVYNQVIRARANGLDLSQLTYSVTWNTNNHQTHTAVVGGNTVTIQNTVAVTVNYRWIPEAYLPAKTLTSTSVSVMSF